MYNEDTTRIPVDEKELWEVLREQFKYVRYVLCDLDAESREEALGNENYSKIAGKVRRDWMAIIRYRNTDEQLDQREYYLEMGRALLPYIGQALVERKLSPEFVQQWGKIMFCHGYVASYVFDDTDSLSDVRKGQGGRKDSQRRWVAHILNSLSKAGFDPEDARAIAGRYVQNIIDKKAYPRHFGEKWFRNMVDGRGTLATSYDPPKMYPKRIEELLALGADGIPPIPPITDLTAFEAPN